MGTQINFGEFFEIKGHHSKYSLTEATTFPLFPGNLRIPALNHESSLTSIQTFFDFF